MDYVSELLSKYSSLREGESLTAQPCPKCKGGRTEERQLSIRRNAGYLQWICWRASCNFRGRYRVGGASDILNSYNRPEVQRKPTPTPVVKDIPAKAKEYLRKKYCITKEHIELGGLQWTNGWSKEDDAGRLYMPVFSWLGQRVGLTARSLTGATPKSLSFTQDSAMCWYHKEGSDTVVIVEDQLSAIRLATYVSSVALMGTYISPSKVHELLSSKALRYCLWLDRDAFNLSIKYAINFKHLIKLEVTKLNKDIKDLTEDELITLLKHEGIIK